MRLALFRRRTELLRVHVAAGAGVGGVAGTGGWGPRLLKLGHGKKPGSRCGNQYRGFRAGVMGRRAVAARAHELARFGRISRGGERGCNRFPHGRHAGASQRHPLAEGRTVECAGVGRARRAEIGGSALMREGSRAIEAKRPDESGRGRLRGGATVGSPHFPGEAREVRGRVQEF